MLNVSLGSIAVTTSQLAKSKVGAAATQLRNTTILGGVLARAMLASFAAPRFLLLLHLRNTGLETYLMGLKYGETFSVVLSSFLSYSLAIGTAFHGFQYVSF